MPINPQIPLAVQYPEPYSPLESYGKGLSIRNLIQQQEIGQEQVKSARATTRNRERDYAENERIRQAIGQKGSLAKALPSIYQINPEKAIALTKALNDAGKAELENQAAQTVLFAKQSERLGSIAGSIRDQATYQAGVQLAVQEGLIPPEAAAKLPQAFEDAEPMLQQFTQAAMTAKEQHEGKLSAWKGLMESLGQAENVRKNKATEAQARETQAGVTAGRAETARHNRELERQARVNEGGRTARATVRETERQTTKEEDRQTARVREMTRNLNRMNVSRETQGLPLLTAPPGSEIAEMEKTPGGPGVRRWGHGNPMPRWLALQYLEKAGGNKEQARAWSDADGWTR